METLRLLIVDDDPEIQSVIRRSLADAGYAVDTAKSAEEAQQLADRHSYHGMIVDLNLPGKDGIELILEMRGAGLTTPVLILSARRSVDDRVKGLELGGDDYLTKPFAVAELLARVRTLLRRNLVWAESNTRLKVEDLELDLRGRRVTRGEETINLSPQEFSLLEYLCRHAGRVVTRSMLMTEVWGMRFQVDTNVVDVHIYRLRGKIDTPGRVPLIRTLRGKGYVLGAS